MQLQIGHDLNNLFLTLYKHRYVYVILIDTQRHASFILIVYKRVRHPPLYYEILILHIPFWHMHFSTIILDFLSQLCY